MSPWFFIEGEGPPIKITENEIYFNDPWQGGSNVGPLQICAVQCGLVQIMSKLGGLEARSKDRKLPSLKGGKVIARSTDSPIKVSFKRDGKPILSGQVIYQAEETTSSS